MKYLIDVNGTIVDPYHETITDVVCEYLIEQTKKCSIDIISGQDVSSVFNKIGKLSDHVGTIYGHSGSEVLLEDGTYMEPHQHEWDPKLIKYCMDLNLEYLIDLDVIEIRDAINHRSICDELSVNFPQYDVVLNTEHSDVVVQAHGKDIVLSNYKPSELTFITDVSDEYSYDFYSASRFEEAGATVIRTKKVENIFDIIF